MNLSRNAIFRIVAAGILAVVVGVGIAGLIWINPAQKKSVSNAYESTEIGLAFSYPKSYFLTEFNDPGDNSAPTKSVILMKDNETNREIAKSRPLQIAKSEGAISIEMFAGAGEADITDWVKTNAPQSHYDLSDKNIEEAVVVGKKIVSYKWASGLYGTVISFVHNGNVLVLSSITTSPNANLSSDFVSIISTMQLI